MPVIILDEHTVNQIAAGEVIERPRSVVKELVENSLDAGATRIRVDIEQGGRQLIQVTDDGCGMSREDAVLSLQRHATSKIQAAEDLTAITTMGFRGEALPSIASVSKLRMVTRRAADPQGVELLVEAGVITDLTEVGAPPGTQISIHRLFFNTPARLKFLRTESTEFGQIAETVSKFALVYHAVDFRLAHNGREVMRRTASPDMLSSIASLYSPDIAHRMLPLDLTLPSLAIRGYVAHPDLTRGSRAHQTFFVNRRWIRSKSLYRAVDEAYHSLLPAGRFPIAIVMIEIDPHLVDVNVHPAKSEVRFDHEGEIFHAVRRAISEALAGADLAPRVQVHARFSGPERPTAPVSLPPTEAPLPPQTPLRMETAMPPAPSPGPHLAVTPSPDQTPVASGVTASPATAHGITILGQLRRTYLLADDGKSLLLIDQHRAQERIIYEKLMRGATGPVEAQRLVIPTTAHLGHREAVVLEANLEELGRFGFEVEPFGSDSFIVRAVPALLGRVDAQSLLTDLAEELAGESGGVERRRERILITTACRSAIKAGDALAPIERDRLVAQLMMTEKPYLCPHGRAIIVAISAAEIDLKFHR